MAWSPQNWHPELVLQIRTKVAGKRYVTLCAWPVHSDLMLAAI